VVSGSHCKKVNVSCSDVICVSRFKTSVYWSREVNVSVKVQCDIITSHLATEGPLFPSCGQKGRDKKKYLKLQLTCHCASTSSTISAIDNNKAALADIY